ncbi:hypothetical protein A0H81_10377 [Grifola frondosa]|uniref:Uncharacterized protein n=1 Tax=Grifola frondosa TaxID=5627 RepID=A0A1C7M0S5_GRIFR|nr:hypothetical protein A0H81_10377 [Grifola frondosa]
MQASMTILIWYEGHGILQTPQLRPDPAIDHWQRPPNRNEHHILQRTPLRVASDLDPVAINKRIVANLLLPSADGEQHCCRGAPAIASIFTEPAGQRACHTAGLGRKVVHPRSKITIKDPSDGQEIDLDSIRAQRSPLSTPAKSPTASVIPPGLIPRLKTDVHEAQVFQKTQRYSQYFLQIQQGLLEDFNSKVEHQGETQSQEQWLRRKEEELEKREQALERREQQAWSSFTPSPPSNSSSPIPRTGAHGSMRMSTEPFPEFVPRTQRAQNTFAPASTAIAPRPPWHTFTNEDQEVREEEYQRREEEVTRREEELRRGRERQSSRGERRN